MGEVQEIRGSYKRHVKKRYAREFLPIRREGTTFVFLE